MSLTSQVGFLITGVRLKKIQLFSYMYVCLCACVWVYVPQHVCVKVSGQLVGALLLFYHGYPGDRT